MGVAFMLCSGALFVAMPRFLIGLFTTDAAVLALGASLLWIAAVFQLFDGLQGVVTGTLRGLGDTRTPMVTNLAAHWLIGLPIGYWLCFVWAGAHAGSGGACRSASSSPEPCSPRCGPGRWRGFRGVR